MKYDASLQGDLSSCAHAAQQLDALGFDGCFTYEGQTDPFFPLLVAAEHSDLTLYTNVAIAFPRSPMHLAYQAFDLQRFSNGRFILGLGTQIQPHIERRYGAVWGKPVQHMRELVQATKAIFDRWQNGTPLDVSGEYYNLNLLPPLFDPGPLECGVPPIWVGALGPRMTQMVAEVADGILIHPFHTEHFLREHTIPNVANGLDVAGKADDTLSFGVDVMVGVYRTEAEKETAERGCRFNLGFYGSTPAYRVTLDAHGWGDLQPKLRQLTKENRWDDLASLVDDEVLRTIAVVGTPAEVASELHRRYRGIASRLGFSMPYATQPDTVRELLVELRRLDAAAI